MFDIVQEVAGHYLMLHVLVFCCQFDNIVTCKQHRSMQRGAVPFELGVLGLAQGEQQLLKTRLTSMYLP